MQTVSAPSRLSHESARISLATISAALLLAAAGLIIFQFASLRSAVVDDLTVQARLIAENSNAALLFRDEKAGMEILNSLHASPSIKSAATFDHYGRILAKYDRNERVHELQLSAALTAEGHVFRQRYLDVAQTVHSEDDRIGTVVLRADLYEMYKRLMVSIAITVSIILASVLVAYLLLARMRGALVAAENHLSFLAHTDSVTSLPNRHAFNERLRYAIEKTQLFGGSVELLLLDLDNFKYVNDTLGHHSGDLLLNLVSRRLQESLREADTICRIGGDEFAIILESSAQTGHGRQVAEKLIRALAAPFLIGEHQIYVSSSLGISHFPRDGSDLDELTRNADTAMYQAKKHGKNTYVLFSPEMDQCSQRRLLVQSQLHKAFEKGDLQLHYQPKLRLEDNSIVGFEALLRWNDPVLGHVGPGEFVPVAEECGLMLPIGAWVIQTACRDMAAWREMGLGDISVAVNLSVRQTKDPHLLDVIQHALERHAVKPWQLDLEITESILMEHIESNIRLLERIRACGIRLSLDDFGTGYSSLAYLKRFKIDAVKIDRAFIKDIPEDEEDKAIVTSIVALAHNLGLTAIAEGVENVRQYAFLKSVQCCTIQGFLVAPALTGEEVQNYLRKPKGSLSPLAAV